ncbi:mediator of RNA polymerase II transcription subunit 34-like [Paramuricea clavata]|uniref:DNA 3'-5' helicase n=1 Tax=Paramuricea clavata TaxID=317549 RepID=A0A6S7L1V6_PARCT|nr:mediator of RNA polymerase II transcription subunit 34-like [Paramuricea clavata]
MELSKETFHQITTSPPQFIYCSAENCIDKDFLDMLNDDGSQLHKSVEAIVVDESHTIETWTGKRDIKGKLSKSKDRKAFREAYGKLAILSVIKVPKKQMLSQLDWIVEKIKNEEKYKERIVKSLKGDGSKRIIIATSALSMGVNFPDIRFIVMFGPPRDILDLHQKAGRAGRDGLSSDILIHYYGQQISHVDEDVREFLKNDDCMRVAAYRIYDQDVVPLLPAHSCCGFCAASCCCDEVEGKCERVSGPYHFNLVPDDIENSCNLYRSVSEEDKCILHDALKEQQMNISSYNAVIALGSVSSHGFSEQVITDVVENCNKIFSVEDVITYSPIFSRNQAMEVLSIFSEVFNDIEEVHLISNNSLEDDSYPPFSLDQLLNSEFTDTDVDGELFDLDVID